MTCFITYIWTLILARNITLRKQFSANILTVFKLKWLFRYILYFSLWFKICVNIKESSNILSKLRISNLFSTFFRLFNNLINVSIIPQCMVFDQSISTSFSRRSFKLKVKSKVVRVEGHSIHTVLKVFISVHHKAYTNARSKIMFWKISL